MTEVRRIAIIVISIIAAVILSYGVWQLVRTTIAKPADVRVLDFNAEQTSGIIFVFYFVVSGHVINDGGSNSNLVQLQLVITSNQTGNILYQTTFSPMPAILAPNEEGTFSQPFSTDDLGGYTGKFQYSVRVLSS
jgi:hypothetical protein